MILVVLTGISLGITVAFAVSDRLGLWPSDYPTRCLYKAIECSAQALCASLIAAGAWAAGKPGADIGASVFTLLAAVSAWLAAKFWDEWRRRRRKKPRGAPGRLAVRLGRLVFVPR